MLSPGPVGIMTHSAWRGDAARRAATVAADGAIEALAVGVIVAEPAADDEGDDVIGAGAGAGAA